MSKRFVKIASVFLLGASLSMPMAAIAQGISMQKSATLARDVNGFHLGMTIEEARYFSPIIHNGGEYYKTTKDEIEYHFGVTPKGRIYRIESTQKLGYFTVDQQFLTTLKRQLTEKYGPPSLVAGTVFWWSLIEPVSDKFGENTRINTMLATASITGVDTDNHDLEIFMLDRRILWSDELFINKGQRESAENKIQF